MSPKIPHLDFRLLRIEPIVSLYTFDVRPCQLQSFDIWQVMEKQQEKYLRQAKLSLLGQIIHHTTEIRLHHCCNRHLVSNQSSIRLNLTFENQILEKCSQSTPKTIYNVLNEIFMRLYKYMTKMGEQE